MEASEKMKDAAFRELQATAGKSLNAYTVGNAPIGHLTYIHEEGQDSEYDGTKVFFYKSQLLDGEVTLESKKASDYLWVTQQELAEYLDPLIADYIVKMVPP